MGGKNRVRDGDVALVLLGAGADATGSEGGVCSYGAQEDGEGASQPYLARSLLVGGGVREGEAENSPGCSGMGASMGGAKGCTLGGVDEHLRVDGPLRDTQVVSMTLTPMLQWDKITANQRGRGLVGGSGGGVSAGGGYYLYNQRAVNQSESSLHTTHTQFNGWRRTTRNSTQLFIRTK